MEHDLELLKVADVAERLRVTTGRVYQLIAEGIIPVVRVGGAIRIPRVAWETWISDQSDKALATLGARPRRVSEE